MDLLFESPSWILSCSIIVLLCVALAIGLLLFVRKHFSPEDLKKSHDVVGFTFSIIGVLYSVILGFTVVSVQDRYNQVLQTIQTEAISIADLYREAGLFPEQNKNEIRRAFKEYVRYVIEKEWWLPEQGNIHTHGHANVERIWEGYYDIDLADERTRIWYSDSISKLNAFLDARLSRQFNARDHLGSMMWSLLVIGALITVCFMFFFGLESLRSQVIMTGLLVGYLAFMLHLIYSLDHVFKGPEGIKPVALEQLESLFTRWDQSP